MTAAPLLYQTSGTVDAYRVWFVIEDHFGLGPGTERDVWIGKGRGMLLLGRVRFDHEISVVSLTLSPMLGVPEETIAHDPKTPTMANLVERSIRKWIALLVEQEQTRKVV